MRIYLDLCCLNRPFDDQSQNRIQLESEAVLGVLGRIEEGTDQLVSSEVLEQENAKSPDWERTRWVSRALAAAALRVCVGRAEAARAETMAS